MKKSVPVYEACNIVTFKFTINNMNIKISLSLSATSGVVDADLFGTTGVGFAELSGTSVYLLITIQFKTKFEVNLY